VNPLPNDQTLYADLFELAPVSLWIEDYSALKNLFNRWRAEGVRDLRAHLRDSPALIAECARQLVVLRVNRQTLKLYGARDLQHLRDNLAIILGDTMNAFAEELGQLWDGQLRLTTHTVNRTLGGDRLHLRMNASVVPGHEARWDRVLIAMEDVTDRHRAEQEARGLFEHSPVSLWSLDFSGARALVDAAGPHPDFGAPAFLDAAQRAVRVLAVNRATLPMFGAADEAALLAHVGQVMQGELRAAFAALLRALAEGRPHHAPREAETRRLDGAPLCVQMQLSLLPGHEHDWGRMLLSLADITARKQAERQLDYLSAHDALTGLRNRASFNTALAHLDGRREEPVSVVVMDLDGLKPTNDRLGHAAGDRLLQRAARHVAHLAPGEAIAARIGGDEFGLLLPGWAEARTAAWVAGLRQALVDDAGGPLESSIGHATREAGAAQPLESTLHRADVRMYDDKRGRYAARGRDRRGA
jgi:diguanylate cyclase (GGDEF)-like protein/PAS domain S-box-containing protein